MGVDTADLPWSMNAAPFIPFKFSTVLDVDSQESMQKIQVRKVHLLGTASRPPRADDVELARPITDHCHEVDTRMTEWQLSTPIL